MATLKPPRRKRMNPQPLKVNERKWGKPLMDAGYIIFPSIILERQQALGLEPIDVNILLHLARYWWDKDNAPHPSKKSIAAAVGVHHRTVQRRIAAMESGGLIKREERRAASNTSKTNLYHFDGLVKAATPYAEEALQERERRRKEDSEKITRRGRPRLRIVSKED